MLLGAQYGAGDIDVISEGDALHLCRIGDAESHSAHFIQKNFGLPKENNFSQSMKNKF